VTDEPQVFQPVQRQVREHVVDHQVVDVPGQVVDVPGQAVDVPGRTLTVANASADARRNPAKLPRSCICGTIVDSADSPEPGQTPTTLSTST
jgi:hypothetical protein